MSHATRIVHAACEGDLQAAEQLLPLVYGELRKLAASKLANERATQTLQPTALVHEAWLRLTGDDSVKWDGRGHFFAAAAEAMRRILIDNARRRRAVKHGAGLEKVSLDDCAAAVSDDATTLLMVDDALEVLAKDDAELAKLVKLRFFVGMTNEEVADALGISERTVKRNWAFARAWLYDWISKERTADERVR